MANETKIPIPHEEVDSEVSRSPSLLLDAVRRYDYTLVKTLLERGCDPNEVIDEERRNPLHVVLQNGFLGHLNEPKMLECVKLLIKYKCDINSKDGNGECPLSLAVHNGFEPCAGLLIEKGANTTVKTPRFKRMHSLATKIALDMPDVTMQILDSGVSLEYKSEGIEFAKPYVKLDWRPIIQECGDIDAKNEKEGLRKNKYRQRETSFLYSLLDVQSYEIRNKYLTHPLVTAFLHLKAKIISQKLRGFQILMTFYPIFYMVFIYFLYFIRCKFKDQYDNNDDEIEAEVSQNNKTTTERPSEQLCEMSVPITVQAYLLAVVVFAFALLEVYMQLRVDTKYLRSWRTWVIRVTLVIMGCTLWPALQFNTVYDITWQYPIAAMGTFFAWVMFLIQMELIPQVKVYLEMLVSIILSVIKIIILFLPLLVGFYMGFNLMFFKIGNIMNFILMTVDVGSNEYEDMIENAKDSRAWFTAIAYIFTVAFIIVIAIVFMNFLLGVSIDDIQQLKKNAKIMSLSNQVQSFFIIDLIFPKRYRVVRGNNHFYCYDPTDYRCKFPERIRTEMTILLKRKYAQSQLQLTSYKEGRLGEIDLQQLSIKMNHLESRMDSFADGAHL